MMQTSQLKFKGDRQYVQSASVFDDILRRFDNHPEDIDFTFHRQTSNQVTYAFEPPESDEDLVAVWRDSTRKIFILDSKGPVVESEPYPEGKLVNLLEFEGDLVKVPANLGDFTFVEGIVAAFKHLLLSRWPERKAKYVFVRLKLREIPANDVAVEFGRVIGDFYEANLYSDGMRLGRMYYGVWR